MKARYLVLVLAVLWLAAAGYFFYLHFAGTGVIPLSYPLITLAMSVICFAAYFWLRKLMGKR